MGAGFAAQASGEWREVFEYSSADLSRPLRADAPMTCDQQAWL